MEPIKAMTPGLPPVSKINVQWCLARLTERSTWLGITTILSSAGVAIRPDLAEQIVQAGTAIAGLILILSKG